MKSEIKTEQTETITLNEKDIEKIVRESLGEKYASSTISLYQNTTPASRIMGAIDDSTEIECKVVLYSKTVVPKTA